jgi:streptomycin 6-kinase
VFQGNDEFAARIGAAMALWSLSDAEPVAETRTSWVLRVTSENGPRGLKLLKPYGADEINGARLMQWWGGEGAAAIDAIDGNDILMEWLEGGTLADLLRADYGRDAEATDVLCDVVAKLHRQRPEALPALWPLDQWMRPLLDNDVTFLPADARPMWQRVQAMLKALLASTTNPGPLHGDLHHDNVLGGPGDWRVIDPKGLFGDPVFDVANLFRNPHNADDLVVQPARINGLADRFAERFGWDRRRILEWAAVLTAISAIWNATDANGYQWELKMLPLLLAAVDQSLV